MAITTLTHRRHRPAATRHLAASSVAHVRSARCGYADSLRPGEARVSLPESAICSGGDR